RLGTRSFPGRRAGQEADADGAPPGGGLRRGIAPTGRAMRAEHGRGGRPDTFTNRRRRWNMRTTVWLAVLALPLLVAAAGAADDKSGVNDEGFVQRWLVLAPIPFGDNESGAQALDREQLKDEAKLKPKAGDKVKVGGKELVWKEHALRDHLLD